MKYAALFFIVCMVFINGCALQQDVLALNNRIALLEKRFVDMNKKNAEFQSRVIKSQSELLHAELNAELERLSGEIQAVSGRIEEADHFYKKGIEDIKVSSENGINSQFEIIKKIEKRLDGLAEKIYVINNRAVSLEKYLNIEPSARKKIKAYTEAKKEFSESEIYTTAKQNFDDGDFEAARKGFKELINKYPKSRHADNAQFWIGETYYREKWYEKAILEYQTVIEKYPYGNKVPSSLLKQGFAFFCIDDKANSRLILNELIKKYPKSNEARIAEKKLESFKN